MQRHQQPTIEGWLEQMWSQSHGLAKMCLCLLHIALARKCQEEMLPKKGIIEGAQVR